MSQLPDTRGRSRSIVELDQLFDGTAVFLPVRPGTKKPARKEWQKLTRVDTTAPEYYEELARNNVAVLLGPPSGNVISIDCDDESFMEEFLLLNARLCDQTLRTKGERGCHVWFRMCGDYPTRVCVIKDDEGKHAGEFRGGSASNMITGVHPSGCEYQLLNNTPVLAVAFEDIQWPEGYHYPWVISEDAEIAQRVGPAFSGDNGKVGKINMAFFAEWVKSKREIVYEETKGSFFLYNPVTGVWDRITDSNMTEVAWETCLEWIDQQESDVPDQLKLQFTHRNRTDLVAMLKSKVVERGFFNTGEYHDIRELIIHAKDGMLTAMPWKGAMKYTQLPFDAKYRSRSRLPWKRVPNPSAPLFEGLLRSAFGEANVPNVKKFLGNLLLNGNPSQSMLIIKGPARSGKSQLVTVLKGIMGEAAVGQLRTSQLAGRFEVGALADKRLLYGPDVAADYLTVDGARMLKALTGGDPLEGEVKYSNDRMTLRGEFHVLLTTNDVLRLAPGEDAGAWRRRLIILETEAVPEDNVVSKLAEKILDQEGNAVFSLLLEGASEALNDMNRGGKLEVPEQFRLGTSGAVVVMGDIGEWMALCVQSGDDSYSTAELYLCYSDWCDRRGETPLKDVIFQRRVKAMLEDRGIYSSHSIERGKPANGYRGLEVTYVA